jgi:hypothetical protein
VTVLLVEYCVRVCVSTCSSLLPGNISSTGCLHDRTTQLRCVSIISNASTKDSLLDLVRRQSVRICPVSCCHNVTVACCTVLQAPQYHTCHYPLCNVPCCNTSLTHPPTRTAASLSSALIKVIVKNKHACFNCSRTNSTKIHSF